LKKEGKAHALLKQAFLQMKTSMGKQMRTQKAALKKWNNQAKNVLKKKGKVGKQWQTCDASYRKLYNKNKNCTFDLAQCGRDKKQCNKDQGQCKKVQPGLSKANDASMKKYQDCEKKIKGCSNIKKSFDDELKVMCEAYNERQKKIKEAAAKAAEAKKAAEEIEAAEDPEDFINSWGDESEEDLEESFDDFDDDMDADIDFGDFDDDDDSSFDDFGDDDFDDDDWGRRVLASNKNRRLKKIKKLFFDSKKGLIMGRGIDQDNKRAMIKGLINKKNKIFVKTFFDDKSSEDLITNGRFVRKGSYVTDGKRFIQWKAKNMPISRRQQN